MASCKHCKAPATLKIQMANFCSVDCAYNHARNMQDKAKKRKEQKAARQVKQNKKDLLELNRRNVDWQHELTQKSFNKMRVLEDLLWFKERGLQPECISCGKKHDFCCGHLKSRGAYSAIRYDRRNTFLQCNAYCNRQLSANIDGTKHSRGYKAGLAERFGAEQAKEIIEYCESQTQTVKYEWQQLEEMRKGFNAEVRRLQKLLN
jgi:hypothetical protein